MMQVKVLAKFLKKPALQNLQLLIPSIMLKNVTSSTLFHRHAHAKQMLTLTINCTEKFEKLQNHVENH
jgi:hypothetical protein